MRGQYQKYDLNVKTQLVEEYIEQESITGISIRRYAAQKGVACSTFKRWLVQYRQYMAAQKPDYAVSVQADSGFIMISPEDHPVSVPSDTDQGIRLRYKDAVLEFEASQLEQVMEILRRW